MRDISTILIFCDSQSAVGIRFLQLGWENKSYKKTAMNIQQSLNILERDGTEVKIQWSLSFFLSILSRSNFDHHLRCGGWLNFEFS